MHAVAARELAGRPGVGAGGDADEHPLLGREARPLRAKSLAVPDADAALNAFTAALGDEESVAGATVKGRFTGRTGLVEWYLREHRIDAVTGQYLGKMEPPTGDPVTPTQSVGQ